MLFVMQFAFANEIPAEVNWLPSGGVISLLLFQRVLSSFSLYDGQCPISLVPIDAEQTGSLSENEVYYFLMHCDLGIVTKEPAYPDS